MDIKTKRSITSPVSPKRAPMVPNDVNSPYTDEEMILVEKIKCLNCREPKLSQKDGWVIKLIGTGSKYVCQDHSRLKCLEKAIAKLSN